MNGVFVWSAPSSITSLGVGHGDLLSGSPKCRLVVAAIKHGRIRPTQLAGPELAGHGIAWMKVARAGRRRQPETGWFRHRTGSVQCFSTLISEGRPRCTNRHFRTFRSLRLSTLQKCFGHDSEEQDVRAHSQSRMCPASVCCGSASLPLSVLMWTTTGWSRVFTCSNAA